MTRDELLAKRNGILEIARARGVQKIRIFGSVARDDSDVGSDVDFLVDFEEGSSLLDHGGLVMDLEEFLGVKVDVVSERGIRPRFRNRVESEAIAI